MNVATVTEFDSVSHHLADDTLAAYAAGCLNQPMETLIACHLTVCPLCRGRSDTADRIGGGVLADTENVPMRADAKDIIRKAEVRHLPEPPPKPAPIAGVPQPLARLLDGPLEQLPWKRMAPGIKQINLIDQPRKFGAFKLLHLEPGVVLSQHSHTERELTYVVKGSYQDEIGRFKAGDIADLDDNDEHQPVVDTAEPCIALIATDSPVRFTGVVSKLLQPFVGL